MGVHRQLGCGFLEPVYQEALATEFTNRHIPFVREVKLPLEYKGQPLETKYCADFICFNSVVVELKALARTSGTEEAQHQLFEGHRERSWLAHQFRGAKPGTPSLVLSKSV
jgi:GxxExxY protein